MSDITEIMEITDTSIKINITESILEDNNKRKLSNDDDELEETISGKKICRDTENFEDSSLIIEPTLSESLAEVTNNESILEENVTESKLSEVAENITLDDEEPSKETLDDKTDETDKTAPIEEGSNFDEGSSEDDYDDSLMISAMNALPKYQTSSVPKITEDDQDDEPIALDSDTEEEDLESDGGENESIEEIHDDEREEDEQSLTKIYNETCLQKRLILYNPKFYLARRLLKKSIKILLTHRTNAKADSQLEQQHLKKEQESSIKQNTAEEASLEVNDKSDQQNEKAQEIEKSCTTVPSKGTLENCEENEQVSANDGSNHEKNENTIEKNNSLPKEDDLIKKNEKDESTKFEDSSMNEIGSLLNEISCCTVDEIVTRYVFCDSDSNSALSADEFSEQLFYCLQENKKDIENLQRLWNEKVHLKFKMREIMERIRRHRVISEIETFGVKPTTQDGQPSNLLSSKSSTTNSENEHYVKASSKISSQSVNRLIQDVRENVLKKEKKRMDEYASNVSMKYDESFDECNSFAANMFQSSSNQGRQGQIIDVQSIINDFRQKNPQEIPRRGRRMKSSFPNSFLMSSQLQSHQNKGDDKMNNATLDHNNSNKSSVGFPEVSLLPVNNFYKNHSPQYGQKSSLLQSILTKQPNKNSLAVQQNSKSSTLARLLTAPEKSFQSPSRSILQQSSKVHNNGEITITPIAGTSRRQMIDDEENSEPPLVIDESDDFDMNDRHNASGSDLLCQGCRRNKALFMCAGCSRQWYCSKECQELAWDDHAESCMV